MQNQESTADSPHGLDPPPQGEVLRQTNKRLTLNLLSQGAAMHAFLTAHHLVSDELEAIRPGLVKWYDTLAVSFSLNYFVGSICHVYGLPSWFWNRVHRPSHPFHRHRLLAAHGRQLWRASKRDLFSRAWKKWVIAVPVIHYVQLLLLIAWVAWLERGKRSQLAHLAKRANSLMWGIDQDRLEARLTTNVAFGNLREPKTAAGRLTRAGAVGYGGVERRDGLFKVVAKAWNWPLVTHELTKGTVELICLHGLNTLDDETYEKVTEEADQIEYETWALQSGAELWRRLLAAVPEDQVLSETLMHIARLDPQPLEQLMMAVVEDPKRARAKLEEFCP